VEYEYHGDERLLVIGPDQAGNLMKVAVVPAQTPLRIFMLTPYAPKFYNYLR